MEQKLTERQTSNSNVEKSSHHSQHRSHRSSRRRRRSYFWYCFTKPFRKREKVSGVRVNQEIREKRFMILLTLVAVLLLCVLIPFVSWLIDHLSANSAA